MKDRLTSIANAEGCSDAEKELLDQILVLAEGDMRRAVTTLQSVHALSSGRTSVDADTIAEIAGLPPQRIVDKLWLAMTKASANFDKMQQAVEDVCASGYSAQSLLGFLLKKVTMEEDLNELGRAELAIRIAEAEKNMIDGADEYLQLMTVCSMVLTWVKKSRASSS